MATLINTTVSDTSAVQLPVGTTSQRPGIPSAGMMRFNSSFGTVETYINSVWYYSPDIIRSGQTLYLDAGEPASYPGSGTTWTDLSGSANNGTLGNGPTYNSANGGYITFDGVNDYVVLTNNILLGNGNTNWTVSAWVKTTTTVNALGQGSVASNSSSGPVWSMMGVNNNKIVYWTYQNSAWAQKLGNKTVNDGTWHNLVWVNYSNYTMNMYVDGIFDAFVANSTSGNNNPINWIGASWAAYFDGSIANVIFYNGIAVSPANIQTNFNAQRKRFGV